MHFPRILLSSVILAAVIGTLAGGANEAVAKNIHPYAVGHAPTETVILTACHPCTGNTFEVPVCLPCGCTGVPSICFKNTIFGCGKLVHEWCCGYKVVIRFKKCGGYRVFYWH